MPPLPGAARSRQELVAREPLTPSCRTLGPWDDPRPDLPARIHSKIVSSEGVDVTSGLSAETYALADGSRRPTHSSITPGGLTRYIDCSGSEHSTFPNRCLTKGQAAGAREFRPGRRLTGA